jgi:WD40 repeat protein
MVSLTHVAARPGGDLLAVTSSEGWLGVWMPIDNRVVATHALGHTIDKVGWTCDGAYLLATADDSLVVLSGDGTDRVATIATGHAALRTFAVHPSQPVVATTGSDGVVRLWDVATGAKRHDLMARTGRGSGGGTALAMDEQSILVGYESGWFAICDHESQHVKSQQLFNGSIASLARVLPASSSFLAGGGQGKLVQLVIEPEAFRVAETWTHPPKPISANTIECAADGRFVVACSDHTAILYAGTQARAPVTFGHACWLDKGLWDPAFIVSAACFVPGTPLVATSHFTGQVKLWHATQPGHGPVEVRFVDDQPSWSADNKPIADPIKLWPELDQLPR